MACNEVIAAFSEGDLHGDRGDESDRGRKWRRQGNSLRCRRRGSHAYRRRARAFKRKRAPLFWADGYRRLAVIGSAGFGTIFPAGFYVGRFLRAGSGTEQVLGKGVASCA